MDQKISNHVNICKSSNVTTKRTKLPTQMKTKKCSMQLKGQRCYPAQHTVKDGVKILHLCSEHYSPWKLKEYNFKKANFTKSSELENDNRTE